MFPICWWANQPWISCQIKIKQNETVHFQAANATLQWRISVTAIGYLLKKLQMRLVQRNKCTIINQKLPWSLPHLAYLQAQQVNLTCRPWVWRQECCGGAGEVPRALLWHRSSFLRVPESPVSHTRRGRAAGGKPLTFGDHLSPLSNTCSHRYLLAVWLWVNYTLFLEKAMTPHYSSLAWKIPWTEEPGRLQSMGSLRVGHDWATSLSLFTFVHWRRKWQLTPVFLPGESQRQWARVCGVTQSRTWLKWLSSSTLTYSLFHFLA